MKNKALVMLTSVAVLMSLISVFLPEAVSIGWHLLHGNSVSFLAWEIPVPWDWRELDADRSIVIQKIGRWNNPPSDAIIAELNLPLESSIDIEQLKKGRMETERKRGHVFLLESRVQLDGETGLCFTFGGNEPPDMRWIACDFPIHRLSVGYIGTESHSHVLNSIIMGIHASK